MSYPLELKDVVKRFGGLTATNHMSFEVNDGESLGLIGPNGAGKTTIFSLIMGEHRQTSGEILCNGEDISSLPTYARIGRGVCRTYQIPRPFSEMDVLENIRLGLMPNNLWQMLTRNPDRYREIELALSVGFSEDDLHRHPAELSMGDLRKLELARTLATDPSIMLLDEVFAGLTAGEIAQIAELINKKRAEGMTLIIVSHDLRSLEPLIDRAIAMNHGSIVAEGSFAKVMADPDVRASYLGGE
ncbi:ABC transporter ATP-binding protein [Hoeflea poritis]|uniref:ATP-binding cassette domain-containing protein n=1 Tax=Hoeflea poritis TaxID=2993659 RepID=A0ABT4VJP5_9HYPH|nr:ATP-binding cassette domain-containing protein [Hoeflea poritis]MDA4844932.1 ATP-binding cassette domain-containing protein [Hoeflea poritis]